MSEGSMFYIQIKVFVPMTDFSDGKIEQLHRNLSSLRNELRDTLPDIIPQGWEAEVKIPDQNEVYVDD